MLNSRLDLLTDYPFDRLRDLLDGTAPPPGVAPLALSIGEPQHTPPAMIAEAVAANAHLWNKYPPPPGTPGLRAAIVGWLRRRFGLDALALDPDRHVVPVAGTREALYMIATLAVDPEAAGPRPVVLMPNPGYHVYAGSGFMSGAEVRFLDTGPDTGFLPDLDAIPEADLARAALFYLCSPANPQGTVADRAYLRRAVELARRFDFLLAMDECYADIYTGEAPISALNVCQDLGGDLDNVAVFHSLSKRSSAPGLRSGFVAGCPKVMAKLKLLRSYGGATIPMPIMAASEALWNDDAHAAENRALYAEKFDLAARILQGRHGAYRPGGGFFLWLDVGDGEAAAKRLWTEAALRVLPGAYLARADGAGNNPGAPYIRVALVYDPATTEDALHRLARTL
ncbi:MAG: aminotransferase class I/II-fold pyridoxal phosphate-dependent enzyme [Hyphomicrobiales bacterium]|nr:aminotransferase class I/II-fold pyridoxal phosphate-dependent enzyme [Hyphomicrobiales bacterium]MCP5370489.1 aminotransferase class I/II-fold pyridoxal phosphate-dependent enzyme [Hyphomicrobiales bacterium]